jgi:hypothetical protein
VSFPAQGAVGLGDFDNAVGIGADEIRMQVSLCFRVLYHGLPQSHNVARVQGIPRRFGSGPQCFKFLGSWTSVLQVANHLFVYLGRVMGFTQIDQGQPSL